MLRRPNEVPRWWPIDHQSFSALFFFFFFVKTSLCFYFLLQLLQLMLMLLLLHLDLSGASREHHHSDQSCRPVSIVTSKPVDTSSATFFSFFILWFIFCLCSFPSDRVQRDDTRLLVIHAAAHPPFHIVLLLLLLLAVVFLFRLTIITGHQTLVKKKRKKILRVSSGSTGQSLISVGWIMDGVGDVDVLPACLPACPCRCCTHCVLPNASGLFNILLHNWSMVLHSKQHSKKSRKEKK